MAFAATVLRRFVVACAVAAAVWVVHGPILSTAPAQGHGAQPHGWSVAPAEASEHLVTDCLDQEQRPGHGHTRVTMPVDLADSVPASTPDLPVVGEVRDRLDNAAGRPAPRVAPPARPPIGIFICVSRT